jgi:hypothetical protein
MMHGFGRFTARRATQAAIAIAVLAFLALAAPLGGRVAAADYASSNYKFATGHDGKGYYQYYDGYAWSDWYGWSDQPAYFQYYKPIAVTYYEAVYVFYTGSDGYIYYNVYGGHDWSGWYRADAGYTFQYVSYAYVANGYLYLYGVGGDGYTYYSYYDGYHWSDWARYYGNDYNHGKGYDGGGYGY